MHFGFLLNFWDLRSNLQWFFGFSESISGENGNCEIQGETHDFNGRENVLF